MKTRTCFMVLMFATLLLSTAALAQKQTATIGGQTYTVVGAPAGSVSAYVGTAVGADGEYVGDLFYGPSGKVELMVPNSDPEGPRYVSKGIVTIKKIQESSGGYRARGWTLYGKAIDSAGGEGSPFDLVGWTGNALLLIAVILLWYIHQSVKGRR